ncbi:norbelladine synthase-like [Rutidosis leptorrhynchoides]|uniref:norbelladine synthase-like n=1 Tax=Rutidosis leptorrhynchoides TaxID=125765 RepID=UPI003A98F4F5
MLGKVSEEREVKASIGDAWEVYCSPKVGTIIQTELAHLFSVEVMEGDRGVGTIVKVAPCPGVSMRTPYKERFTKTDHEKKTREIEIVEGGYLDFGLTSCRITLELIEKSKVESCIARLTLEYEASEEVASIYNGSHYDLTLIGGRKEKVK